MTLVLAIRCRDGIVLASDGQATSDALGQPTKHAVRKLYDVAGRVAWGAAGSIGLQQNLREELGELDGLDSTASGVRERLAHAMVGVQQLALRQHVPVDGAGPPELACIFCWYDGLGRPRILEVPRTGGDHQFHERYCAIGTGDIFARFALASIKLLGTEALTLEQAKMVAYKTIADAIDVAAFFLGPPIQMYTVTPAGAMRVPAAELDGGLSDSVDGWRARQRETLGPLASGDPAAPIAVETAAELG